MAETPKRPRLMFDCPEELRRAIKIRAAKSGKDPSQVIVAALRSFLPEKEIKEAQQAIAEEANSSGPAPPSSRRGRKPKVRQDEG